MSLRSFSEISQSRIKNRESSIEELKAENHFRELRMKASSVLRRLDSVATTSGPSAEKVSHEKFVPSRTASVIRGVQQPLKRGEKLDCKQTAPK